MPRMSPVPCSESTVDDISVDSVRAAPPLVFGRVVVIGGGCYGSWYAQQLTRAVRRGALRAREIVVVDRDPQCKVALQLAENAYDGAPVQVVEATWEEYLATWLAAGDEALAGDAMVPSPLMPHLCLDWLMARARDRWPDRRIQVVPLRGNVRRPTSDTMSASPPGPVR
jgi:hypothetical protein